MSNLRIEIDNLQKQTSLNAEVTISFDSNHLNESKFCNAFLTSQYDLQLQEKIVNLESRLSECKVLKSDSQSNLESTHSQTLTYDLVAVEKLQEVCVVFDFLFYRLDFFNSKTLSIYIFRLILGKGATFQSVTK